ncbi:MAG: CDP-glycerol glycerophosphotransferase family protein [Minisyncoccia bacterium]|jgi:hypothetical protein
MRKDMKAVLHKLKNKLVRLGSALVGIFWLCRARVDIVRAKRRGFMTVIAEITTTNEFFYLQSVLAELIGDGACVVVITHDKLMGNLRKLIGSSWKEGRPDLVDSRFFDHFPWVDFYLNATLSYDIKVPKRAHYKIHFPHTVTSKTKYDVFSPAIDKMTDVFLTGEAFKKDMLTFCADHRIAKIPKLHEIGCPKYDILFELRDRGIDRKAFIKGLGLDPSLPTVFYAATWNQNTSVFTWLDRILEIPERFKANLIVKIHPGSYIDPTSKKGSGGVDWRSFFDNSDIAGHRIYNAYEVDSPEFIMGSDLAVTDISTIWIEFYFLRKPMIFLDIPRFFEDHEMNSLGDFRPIYGSLVKTPKEFYAAIARSLTVPREARPDNAPSIDDRLLYNRGKATAAAVAKLHEMRGQIARGCEKS